MKPLVQELMSQVSKISICYERKEVVFYLQPRHRPNGPGAIRVAVELMPEVQAVLVLIDDPDRDHFIEYSYLVEGGEFVTGSMRERKANRSAF